MQIIYIRDASSSPEDLDHHDLRSRLIRTVACYILVDSVLRNCFLCTVVLTYTGVMTRLEEGCTDLRRTCGAFISENDEKQKCGVIKISFGEYVVQGWGRDV